MMLLAPFVGGACKFYPSCSNYAYEAVARHGARRGSVLAIKRLLRCPSFHAGRSRSRAGGASGTPAAEALRGRWRRRCGYPSAPLGQEAEAHKPAAGLRGLELRQ